MIKGKPLRKASQAQIPDVASGVLGVIQLTQDLSNLKNDLTTSVQEKIEEADVVLLEALNATQKALQVADEAVQSIQTLKQVHCLSHRGLE